MQIISDPGEFRKKAMNLRCRGKVTALVPTMGFFHEGHLSLMRWARENADHVFVSLFVNPAQFGPGEDLQAYPRDWERDRGLASAAGVDILFAPTEEGMYERDFSTWVDVPELSRHLCGKNRPGHFRGMATVVTKLLNLSLPVMAVFGKKDWQQLAVIRRMVRDLNLPVKIQGHPIVREEDGLALSSRNSYLTPEERKQAPRIYQGLLMTRRRWADGETEGSVLLRELHDWIRDQVPMGKVDYLEIVDPERLEPIARVEERGLLAVAIRLGRARLIDNIELER